MGLGEGFICGGVVGAKAGRLGVHRASHHGADLARPSQPYMA